MFKWFLKRLWNNVDSTRSQRRRARRQQLQTLRPWVETLEDRLAPTVTLTTSPGGSVVVGSGMKLTDSATLAGGNSPTGLITFTLIGPTGTTVDTETAMVSGNNTYTTPTGFLPGSAGTYQWQAS